MKKVISIIMLLAVALSVTAAKPKFELRHLEPLSWWVGMNMPLQLMANGEGISAFDVDILPANQGLDYGSQAHYARSTR